MLKEFTCIICPNGCEIEAEIADGKILSLEGAACPKGEAYVRQELTEKYCHLGSGPGRCAASGQRAPYQPGAQGADLRCDGGDPKDYRGRAGEGRDRTGQRGSGI